MTGYDLFKVYLGIKAHFQKSYDYSRYGPVNAKPQTYNKRRDRYFFEKLSKKLNTCDVVNFFVANFMNNSSGWIGDLIDERSFAVYTEWQRRYESMDYRYQQEIHALCEWMESNGRKFADLFDCSGNKHPVIFQMLLQNKISPETFVILNDILGFLPKFDERLKNDLAYQTMVAKYKKYKAFLTNLDIQKYRKVLRTELESMSLV